MLVQVYAFRFSRETGLEKNKVSIKKDSLLPLIYEDPLPISFFFYLKTSMKTAAFVGLWLRVCCRAIVANGTRRDNNPEKAPERGVTA